ncbi:MAG: hypothetical protein WBO32_18390 [Cyclobacteriaceae bacterium]
MVDFKCGTLFGIFDLVKMKFSNKDLLLLFGILIAVIISLTTMVFKDYSLGLDKTTRNTIPSTTGMASPSLLKKAIDRIEFRF